MRKDHKGEPTASRAGRPPPRPRRAGALSSAVLKVRTTPDELDEIDAAAKRSGVPRADFIRRAALAAAGAAGPLPAPVPPSTPLQRAAAVLSGGNQVPDKDGTTQRVVVELSAPLAEALAIASKAAKLRKNQVVTAALIFLGIAHLRGLVPEFAAAVAQMQTPDPMLVRRAALAALALSKKPRSEWSKAETTRAQLTLRAGQIRDFRAGAQIAGLSASEFFHAIIAAAAKEGPNPPPADAVNSLTKAVRELNSASVLLNQLMRQIHLLKFRQADHPDEAQVRNILAGVADTAAVVRTLLTDWHPRNPYKR